jgi:hypothetical protein
MKILDKIELCKNYFYVTIVHLSHKYVCACHSRKGYIYFCPDKRWHQDHCNVNYYFSTLIEAKQCIKKYHPEAIILDDEIFVDKVRSQKDLDFNTHCCNEKTVE